MKEGKIVVRLGQVTEALGKAVQESRTYFEPAVAKKLREEKGWKIKDYLIMAKHFGSSHIFAFSQSEEHNNLKIVSLLENGKTYYFKIDKYLHASKISQKVQHVGIRTNGYFVMDYNIGEKDPVKELVEELKKNVKTSHLTSRVLVLKSLGEHKYVMTQYVMKKEEKKGKANLVKLALEEIGPRFELKLQKIEEGVCSGEVVYHTHIHKTPEEIQERKRKKRVEEELRAQRRKEQEENVRRKKQKRQGGDMGGDGADGGDVDGEGVGADDAGSDDVGNDGVGSDDVDADNSYEAGESSSSGENENVNSNQVKKGRKGKGRHGSKSSANKKHSR